MLICCAVLGATIHDSDCTVLPFGSASTRSSQRSAFGTLACTPTLTVIEVVCALLNGGVGATTELNANVLASSFVAWHDMLACPDSSTCHAGEPDVDLTNANTDTPLAQSTPRGSATLVANSVVVCVVSAGCCTTDTPLA